MTTNTQNYSTRTAPNHRMAAPTAAKRRKSEFSVLSLLGQIALIVWAIIILGPILWTLLASFKDNSEIFGSAWSLPTTLRWDNYSRAWSQAHLGTLLHQQRDHRGAEHVRYHGIRLDGRVRAGPVPVLRQPRASTTSSSPASHSRCSSRSSPLFFVVKNTGTWPLIGQFIGLNTRGGLILVYIAYSLPFTVFFMTAFFKTLPTSVAEAAMIDGASHTRLFFRVMLPMARSGLISIGIFNVVGQWTQYNMPVVLTADDKSKWVLTQGIADISVQAGYHSDWPALFAALVLAILPMIVVYAIFQRQIQSGLTAGAVK